MKKMPQKKSKWVAPTERKDMIRYAVLVGFGIAVCIWMWRTQPVSAKAAFVYIVMAVGSLVGYVVFRWWFR